MAVRSARQTLTLPESKGNRRPATPTFFLDPVFYRAFPVRRRAQLVALFNLLVAFAGKGTRPVLATQPELAASLGCSVRQVRYLEADLEELGAVRSLRDLPGLRGGRALELVPVEEWIPEELWKGPRRNHVDGADDMVAANTGTYCKSPHGSAQEPVLVRESALSPDRGEVVDNPSRAARPAAHPGTTCRPEAQNALIHPRARQSNSGNELTRHACEERRQTEALPVAELAGRLFRFLARKTTLSGRRWAEALPQLALLVRARGADGAWTEVERIAQASRQAMNPGGYAYACLFPEGLPEKPGALLRALERPDNAGPLFQSLDRERAGKAPGSAPPVRTPTDATLGTDLGSRAP